MNATSLSVSNGKKRIPRISCFVDIEGHCERVANLVQVIRYREYLRSGGKTEGYRLGHQNIDLGLSLSQIKETKSCETPVKKSLLPSLKKRDSLFGKKSRSDTDKADKSILSGGLPISESAVRENRRFEIGNSSKQTLDSVLNRIKEFKTNSKNCSSKYTFLNSFPDEEFSGKCGMMSWMWDKSRGLSPINKPIVAGFKEHFQDFIVQEIPISTLEEESPKPLPRLSYARNFSIPEPPAHVKEIMGMPTTDANLFSSVDVDAQLKAATSLRDLKGVDTDEDVKVKAAKYLDLAEGSASVANNEQRFSPDGRKRLFIQAIMRKKRLPHSTSIRLLASALGVSANKISYAGIKDYFADTVQYVRIEGVSPAQLLSANEYFKKRSVSISLSDFTYHEGPLRAGDLEGNAFTIRLRNVSLRDLDRLQENIKRVSEFGCLNYFGSQRFSFFGGKDDPFQAIIRGNWLLFAFRFLNFTDNPNISLRDLLQRPLKFPTAAQNQYRHAVIKRLKMLKIEPTILSLYPVFSKTPNSFTDIFTNTSKQDKPSLIFASLKSSFFDILFQDRNISTQALLSYYWNIVLSARYSHHGTKVIVGDIVDTRSSNPETRFVFVTEENKDKFTHEDIVLPHFSLGNAPLPHNCVGDLYKEVCEKFGLAWEHFVPALASSMKPGFRPMFVRPTNITLKVVEGNRDSNARDVLLSFSLKKGSYASIVLAEILCLDRCAGAGSLKMRPRPYATEWQLGERDSNYVQTMEGIYKGELGVSFVGGLGVLDCDDEASNGDKTVPDHKLPESAAVRASESYRHLERDYVFEEISKWSEYHLVLNSIRNFQANEEKKNNLFEKSIGQTIESHELDRYINGHHIPASPNADLSNIWKTIAKRRRKSRRFSRTTADEGEPKSDRSSKSRFSGPRVARRAQKKSFILRPDFKLQNVDTWNFVK